MRGKAARQVEMLTAVTPDVLVPHNHPIRRIKPMANQALSQMSSTFDRMYAADGCPLIPPEHLLRGLDEVNGEWSLICTGHNPESSSGQALLKLYRFHRQSTGGRRMSRIWTARAWHWRRLARQVACPTTFPSVHQPQTLILKQASGRRPETSLPTLPLAFPVQHLQ